MQNGNQITIQTPDGVEKTHTVSADQASLLSFTEWLSHIGVELNYRCGQRGVCKGCEIHSDHQGSAIKACQLTFNQLPNTVTIRIPGRSSHDQSLYGVTEFNLVGGLQKKLVPESRDGHGLAIDVGTTTIAIALWDLRKSLCIGTISGRNTQDQHGDNIVSRIDFAINSPQGLIRLQQKLLHGSILPLVTKLLEQHEIDQDQITECIVAANTVMLHTISGDSLQGFGAYPFHSVYLERKCIPNPLPCLSNLNTWQLLPGFGPFVGSDITAGAIASGIHEQCGNTLLIDFGTNGEILLKAKNQYFVTATAAGPAFEGGILNCGKKAQKGVISSLELNSGTWSWTTIGYQHLSKSNEPTGISGAAYIDFIACALREGLINMVGRFDLNSPLVETCDLHGEQERIIRITKEVFVSEKDVAELIQAKAAIAAGVKTLLDLAGIASADLDRIFIAGGFGYHLNLDHARNIGLIPETSSDRTLVVGNASLGGTSIMMASPSLLETADWLTQQAEVIELNQQDVFEDHYIDSMLIGNT